ncbi:MAG TPA: hypothetical protein VHR66_12290 [Gemmataceae bacterium]|jgi:hypothetical protein|nr:hypothetical protein [Gemmataceae bacterium]
MAAGSWTLAEELFARADPAFVDELRRVHFAERLGEFAARWFADPRPFARNALLEYLSHPLNCYRHEPLVKRLFKLAEKAGDDIVMGAFLVAFDRSVRRARKTRTRFKHESLQSRSSAEVVANSWLAEGFTNVNINEHRGTFYATASKQEPVIVMPGNTKMPRPAQAQWKKNWPIDDGTRQRYERRHLLFSLPTRRYLRRRAWRYFRNIGKSDPARYVKAAVAFLPRFTDADIDTDIHLLDNCGLMHVLFEHCPALVSEARGWQFAAGMSIADLAPAPRFEAAWAGDAAAVFQVLLAANARAVRQWAARMLRKHHDAWLRARPVTELLRLADHADPDLAALGFDLLERAPDLASVAVDEWLTRLNGDNLEKLQRLAALLTRRLDAGRVAASEVLRLAGNRSKPVAELGLHLLQQKTFAETDAPELLALVQAECSIVRPALVDWLRSTLSGFGAVRGKWILEFLDSKHADVRGIGWAWLHDSELRDDPTFWHYLIESPYDDVRGRLVAELSRRTEGADPDAVCLLWATVLLNVARGGRQKPGVITEVVNRLASQRDEADRLLPLLAVAVRSVRGPEFRVGLAAIVGLAERQPSLLPAIQRQFPELQL